MAPLKTVWQLYTYDVWGNEEDGFQVNDIYKQGYIGLYAQSVLNNKGTDHEFTSASVSDNQLRKEIGIDCDIEVDGDDTTYYISSAETCAPLCEIHCISHSSLSPTEKTQDYDSYDWKDLF